MIYERPAVEVANDIWAEIQFHMSRNEFLRMATPKIEAALANARAALAAAAPVGAGETRTALRHCCECHGELEDKQPCDCEEDEVQLCADHSRPAPADPDWPAEAATETTTVTTNLCRGNSHLWFSGATFCHCRQRVLDGDSSRPAPPTATGEAEERVGREYKTTLEGDSRVRAPDGDGWELVAFAVDPTAPMIHRFRYVWSRAALSKEGGDAD